MYVCASCVTSLVFWHELDFIACRFIHYIFAMCIDHVNYSELQRQSFMNNGGELIKWTLVGLSSLCSKYEIKSKNKTVSLLLKVC